MGRGDDPDRSAGAVRSGGGGGVPDPGAPAVCPLGPCSSGAQGTAVLSRVAAGPCGAEAGTQFTWSADCASITVPAAASQSRLRGPVPPPLLWSLVLHSHLPLGFDCRPCLCYFLKQNGNGPRSPFGRHGRLGRTTPGSDPATLGGFDTGQRLLYLGSCTRVSVQRGGRALERRVPSPRHAGIPCVTGGLLLCAGSLGAVRRTEAAWQSFPSSKSGRH